MHHKVIRTRNNVSLGRTLPSVEYRAQRVSLLIAKRLKLLRLIRLAHKNKLEARLMKLTDKLRLVQTKLANNGAR